MTALIERVLNSARNYTVLDYTFLKLTLFSLGALAGAYFSEFVLSYSEVIWGIFSVSYVWIIYRTFVKHVK